MATTVVVAVPSSTTDVAERAADLFVAARAVASDAEVVLLCGECATAAVPVDAVQTVVGPALDVPDARAWALAFAAVCEELQPSLVLFGDDAFDRAVAAFLAQRLRAAVITGAIELRWNGAAVTALRGVLSGAGVQTCTTRGGALPVVCLARGAAAAGDGASAARSSPVPAVQHNVDAPPAARIVGERTSSGPALRRARIVVAGGAGVGGAEGFALLRELARVLDAAPAAARGAIVNGWATAAEKVGLTGASVAPDLYLAVGISGASQHMAGCRRARVLVAVNADRGAPVFRYAKYGIVADSRSVLEALLARLATAEQPAGR